MGLRKVRSKSFKTKADASKWAKDEKSKQAKGSSFKWETNRLSGDGQMKWEAVLYREV